MGVKVGRVISSDENERVSIVRCEGEGDFVAQWKHVQSETQRLEVGEFVVFRPPFRSSRDARGICVISPEIAADRAVAHRTRQANRKAYRKFKGQLCVARSRHRRAERLRIEGRINEITEQIDAEPSERDALDESFAERTRLRRGEGHAH